MIRIVSNFQLSIFLSVVPSKTTIILISLVVFMFLTPNIYIIVSLLGQYILLCHGLRSLPVLDPPLPQTVPLWDPFPRLESFPVQDLTLLHSSGPWTHQIPLKMMGKLSLWIQNLLRTLDPSDSIPAKGGKAS